MTRTALELADALDRCQDELLVFGSDFYHPVGEAAHMLRKLHIMDEYAINEIAALRKVNAELLGALRNLLTAVTFADPPKEFNCVLCHEARVPVGFVNEARAAIAKAIRERSET